MGSDKTGLDEAGLDDTHLATDGLNSCFYGKLYSRARAQKPVSCLIYSKNLECYVRMYILLAGG
jgi:hypothetical protein